MIYGLVSLFLAAIPIGCFFYFVKKCDRYTALWNKQFLTTAIWAMFYSPLLIAVISLLLCKPDPFVSAVLEESVKGFAIVLALLALPIFTGVEAIIFGALAGLYLAFVENSMFILSGIIRSLNSNTSNYNLRYFTTSIIHMSATAILGSGFIVTGGSKKNIIWQLPLSFCTAIAIHYSWNIYIVNTESIYKIAFCLFLVLLVYTVFKLAHSEDLNSVRWLLKKQQVKSIFPINFGNERPVVLDQLLVDKHFFNDVQDYFLTKAFIDNRINWNSEKWASYSAHSLTKIAERLQSIRSKYE
ncbi:MAG: PrsW family intramembrane metalloprotease [Ignavibacteria bacterium]|nr:PrsW family intramembrane metalloprotease [Ignavibacteria bacterium]